MPAAIRLGTWIKTPIPPTSTTTAFDVEDLTIPAIELIIFS
ncbi:unannotated protein [freshwater metagenome]|jgi:hypothetical protein|uniref:Unannotated protein n=1 Tax=freshwater metagenome TaxID=449393 RepID=A0A6J6FUN7_9ZZZZ